MNIVTSLNPNFITILIFFLIGRGKVQAYIFLCMYVYKMRILVHLKVCVESRRKRQDKNHHREPC